jgi:branched-chain amino acid transport system permease protein
VYCTSWQVGVTSLTIKNVKESPTSDCLSFRCTPQSNSDSVLEGLYGLCKQAMKRFRTPCLLVVFLFTLVFPLLIGDQTTVSIAVNILLLTAAAAAWNIFSGYTGYLSLGSVTYFGLGAYTLALICQDWHIPGGFAPFFLVPLAGLVAGLFAIPLGWLALRTKSYTFIVITIALFFIFQLLASNLGGLTNGSSGIFFPLPDWAPGLFDLPFYYVALALLLLILSISWWIRYSKFGLGLRAIRDDEDRAFGLGINIQWYKLGAYVLSAICIGMIGSVVAYYSGQVFPQSAFDQTFDINVVVIVYLGGTGTVMGPLVGGLLIQPFQTYLTSQIGASALGVDHILLGACLLGIILVAPEGIVPTLHRWRRKSTSMVLQPGGKSVKMPAPMSQLIQMDATFRSTDSPAQVTVVPGISNAVTKVSPEPDGTVNSQEVEVLSVPNALIEFSPEPDGTVNSQEVLNVPNALIEFSPEPDGTINSQETIVPGVPIEQWSNQNIWPLPFDSGESLFSSTGTMGRVKAQRLVPISHAEASIMTTQEKVPTSYSESFRATQEKVPTPHGESFRATQEKVPTPHGESIITIQEEVPTPHGESIITIQEKVPTSHGESFRATQEKVPTPHGESFRATQEKVPTSSTASWRCPVCRKPFHLKGNICFCPRCGIFRPVSMAE